MTLHQRLIGWALCSVVLLTPLQAQEKYSVVLERSRQLSPYEAVYLLMDYQYWHPDYAGIYYQLGNLTYGLLPTRDPLHHYQELSTLLYQSRLFYGNCLHFAKDQKLPGWQYPELADGQKKIEYETLRAFVSPRLEDVKRQKIACDSIHRSFVRMSERYNRCQALFSAFLTHYTREKTAHLLLQQPERDQLTALALAADSLEADIAAYRNALALKPVEGYDPVFRKEPVVLYRLDGLTHTDFLQNDIALWDYSEWVSRFLAEQRDVYERLYADLEAEYSQLLRLVKEYRAGRTISGKTDAALVGRCHRLGLTNDRVDSVAAMQQTVRNGAAEQMIAKSDAPQTIQEILPLLQIAAERRGAEQDSAIRLMNAHLIQLAQPLRAQQVPTYTHPVSGEVLRYAAPEGITVHSLFPDEKGYRCVVTDIAGTTDLIYLRQDLSFERRMYRYPGEQPLLFTRMPGKTWALITDKNVYFLP